MRIDRETFVIEHLLREESPELFITVFSETHRASHLLWHTAPSVGNRPGPAHPRHPTARDSSMSSARWTGRWDVS
jgi:hypothetical protein